MRGAGEALGWRGAQLGGVQVISFLRLVVLAQLLAPEAFGLVAVGAATIAFLMGLSNLGVAQALIQRPSPTNDEYDVAWTLRVLRGAGVTILLAMVAPVAASLFGEPAATNVVRAMALRPLIDALASIGVQRLTRQLAFRRLAVTALVASLMDAGVAIALAPSLGVWAMVIGTLSGALMTTGLSYAIAPHRPRLLFETHAMQELVRFGRWIMLTGIVSLIASVLTQFGVSRMLGAGALGQYVVASRLAFLAAEASSSVVGAVAFPLYAAYRGDQARAANAFGTLLTGQFVLLLPVAVIIVVLAPLFEATLGGQWLGTAATVQVLALASIAGLFGDAVVPLLHGKGEARQAFAIEVVQSGTQLVMLYPLMRRYGITGAALALFAGVIVSQVAAAIFSRAALRATISTLTLSRFAAAVIAAAAAAVTGAVIAGAVPASVGGLTVAAAGSAGAAAFSIWLLDRALRLRLKELLPWDPAWRSLAPAVAAGDATPA
jgi:PST family polysaccharide transporter/lipopolysaccharide exporter